MIYKSLWGGVLCAHHDENPIELDTTQDEPSTTQIAGDEDSALNTDNDDMSFDTKKMLLI